MAMTQTASRRVPVDPEALLRACLPGGSCCDPQHVADEIRAYCATLPPLQGDVRPGWIADQARAVARLAMPVPEEGARREHVEGLLSTAMQHVLDQALRLMNEIGAEWKGCKWEAAEGPVDIGEAIERAVARRLAAAPQTEPPRA